MGYDRCVQIALLPVNSTVGDLAGNARALVEAIRDAKGRGADLAVTPELGLTGYPPRDLLLRREFVAACAEWVGWIAQEMPRGITALVGSPMAGPEGGSGGRATNTLLALRDGEVVARHDKRLLPDYDIFDEPRYFAAGRTTTVVEVAGVRVGLAICEDAWRGEDTLGARESTRYAGQTDPIDDLKIAGAQLIAIASASPFREGHAAKQSQRLVWLARHHRVTIASVNALGANDDLIFDGSAEVVMPLGVSARAELFRGEALVAPFIAKEAELAMMPELEQTYRALVLGIRDYARKARFSGACLGVSGGLDSALTAALGVAALGAGNVLGVAMPSRYSSQSSLADARALCGALGCGYYEAPIEEIHASAERTTAALFTEMGSPTDDGLTHENLQSRARGLLMMAVSNTTGKLLLTTGNKSELAVGYTTLYGDMNGGLAPIADLYKTECYRLAGWINTHHRALGFARAPIPQSTIEKPPSAELRPGQTDQDSLPPYDELDEIIRSYVDEGMELEGVIAHSALGREEVSSIVRKIDLSTYKRFQYAVGLKVSPTAFGRGRRWPIVAALAPDRLGPGGAERR